MSMVNLYLLNEKEKLSRKNIRKKSTWIEC